MRSRKQLLLIGGGAGILLLLFIGVSVIAFRGTPIVPEPAPQKTPPELTTEEIVARSEKSVAMIKTPIRIGSGFLVATNLLATNAHLIEGAPATHIKVRFPSAGPESKKEIDVRRVVYYDRKRDLALLEVRSNSPSLKINSEATISRGQKVIAIGNPGVGDADFENAVSAGNTSTVIDLPPNGRMLQLSISINPGNSGGPALSGQGDVLGVVTSSATFQEGIAFAIPAEELVRAIGTVNAMTEKGKDLFAARHDARAVFLRVLFAANEYTTMVGTVSGMWHDAANRFQPYPSAAIKKLQDNFDGTIVARKIQPKYQLEDVDQVIGKVGTDERLPEATRRSLAELWQIYQALRRDFHVPVGTLQEYDKRYRENLLAAERLEDTLRVALNVDANEITWRKK